MKCCSCGGEIRDDARFCPLCGADQTAAPVVEEPAFIPAEPVPAEEPACIPAEPAPQPKYEYVPQPEPTPVATAQPVYQTVYQTAAPSRAPRYQLPDRRGLLKMIFLGLITGGIYNMVIMSRIAEEINMVASKHDGQRTQQYLWVSVLTGLTLGIYAFVWIHGLCNRIGGELKRRGINYKFSASTFWLWGILGSLLFGIGPLVYTHKFCKASNLMNRDYNING
jgi:hypothetical protein